MTSVRKATNSFSLRLAEVRKQHGEGIGPAFIAIDLIESLGITSPLLVAALGSFIADAWEQQPDLTCRQVTDSLFRRHGINLFSLALDAWRA